MNKLYTRKFENQGKMEKFLEKYNIPKLNEEEAESLNGLTVGEIEAVIKKLLAHKSPGLDGFTGEFYKTFKEEITPILHRLSQKIQEEGKLQALFMKRASSYSQHQKKTEERKLQANVADEHRC